ncbi:helix-turn-helix transcriptional regulator [Vagococcus fluvialis]|uniref:helix-turn-helix domain-containing protein n=1 Tax=Vagococcus fluvialis TaxID=2738 RepID=UPI0037B6496C
MSEEKKVDPKAVGNRIRTIRQNLGYSMTQFAERIDNKAKSGTVSNWETGKNLPNNDRLKKISELGNVSINYLLEGKNNIVDLSENEITDLFTDLANTKINYSGTTTFSKSMLDLAFEKEKDFNTLQIEKKLKHPSASVKQINFLLSCEHLIESNNINKDSTIYSDLSEIINTLADIDSYSDENINNLTKNFNNIINNLV